MGMMKMQITTIAMDMDTEKESRFRLLITFTGRSYKTLCYMMAQKSRQ